MPILILLSGTPQKTFLVKKKNLIFARISEVTTQTLVSVARHLKLKKYSKTGLELFALSYRVCRGLALPV
jgi:hypothetical protein